LTVDDLLEREGYDAVFIGTGAGLPKFLNIPGKTIWEFILPTNF